MIWSAILGINCTSKVSNFTRRIALQIMLLHIQITQIHGYSLCNWLTVIFDKNVTRRKKSHFKVTGYSCARRAKCIWKISLTKNLEYEEHEQLDSGGGGALSQGAGHDGSFF